MMKTMKNMTKIFALVLAMGLISAMLVSCTKTPTNSAAFKETASAKGYTVDDAIAQFENVPHIKEAFIAYPSDKSFQIEFYVTDNADSARNIFANQSASIESQKGNNYAGSSVNGKNYGTRTLTSGGKYTMVAYIENTLVFVPQTDSSNKSAIEAFLKEIKY